MRMLGVVPPRAASAIDGVLVIAAGAGICAGALSFAEGAHTPSVHEDAALLRADHETEKLSRHLCRRRIMIGMTTLGPPVRPNSLSAIFH